MGTKKAATIAVRTPPQHHSHIVDHFGVNTHEFCNLSVLGNSPDCQTKIGFVEEEIKQSHDYQGPDEGNETGGSDENVTDLDDGEVKGNAPVIRPPYKEGEVFEDYDQACERKELIESQCSQEGSDDHKLGQEPDESHHYDGEKDGEKDGQP
ncbi:MAG: hypothetical protein NTX75_08995 [Proteobacteria bacterium]|nr:hypothetical protein [Pseudomonadota bacterium]